MANKNAYLVVEFSRKKKGIISLQDEDACSYNARDPEEAARLHASTTTPLVNTEYLVFPIDQGEIFKVEHQSEWNVTKVEGPVE